MYVREHDSHESYEYWSLRNNVGSTINNLTIEREVEIFVDLILILYKCWYCSFGCFSVLLYDSIKYEAANVYLSFFDVSALNKLPEVSQIP